MLVGLEKIPAIFRFTLFDIFTRHYLLQSVRSVNAVVFTAATDRTSRSDEQLREQRHLAFRMKNKSPMDSREKTNLLQCDTLAGRTAARERVTHSIFIQQNGFT
jgi:hypothetical protein